VRKAPARSRGPAMRNYKAMKDDKLLTCLRELAYCHGDAYERVQNGRYAGTVRDHYEEAKQVALSRNLPVPLMT